MTLWCLEKRTTRFKTSCPTLLIHIAFSFAMAASQKKRLCKGPKLSDHALFGAFKNWESCSKFLDDYGANPTLSCSTQRSSNDILSQSFVRLRIPRAQFAGNRDLWLCSACGWVDYTTGCDRALFRKFGGMTKAGWLHSKAVRSSAVPKRTVLVTCNQGPAKRISGRPYLQALLKPVWRSTGSSSEAVAVLQAFRLDLSVCLECGFRSCAFHRALKRTTDCPTQLNTQNSSTLRCQISGLL